MITVADIKILNETLEKGHDVEVQRTKDGIRIIEKRVRVIDRRIDADRSQSPHA